LFVLTRTSDQRQYLGPEVQKMLGTNFTWWYNNQASTLDKDTWVSYLEAHSLPPNLTPYIEVTPQLITMANIYGPVFSYYCFELYTAGYSYGMLPSSMMENYLDSNYPGSFDWVAFHDATCYSNPVYDGLEASMENSSTIGSALAVGTGVYDCYAAQWEMMGGTGDKYGPCMDPYWVGTGYSPTLSSDYNTIGEPGVGLNNWYTFLNAYPTGTSPYASSNALYYGMRSPTECLNNVYSYSAVYDAQVVQEIYDTPAIANPYNLSQLLPYIATSWSAGTWTNTGAGTWATPKTCSNYTINMRNDVEWQDVPGPETRNAFTWNNGSELNGPMVDRYMTPLDYAFSLAYGALGWGFTIAYSYSSTINLDHVVISSVYEPLWEGQIGYNTTVNGTPWCNVTYAENMMGIPPDFQAWPLYQLTTPGAGLPYYNTTQYLDNFVQFSPTLSPYSIQIYESELQPWLGTYYALGYYILPMDIFSNLALGPWTYTLPNGKSWTTSDETIMDLEPLSYNTGTGADLEYGSGPFVLVDDSAAASTSNFRLQPYLPGMSYGPGLTGTYGTAKITTDHGYFLSSPVRQADADAVTNSVYWKQGTSTLWSEVVLHNYGTATYNVTVGGWEDYADYVNGTWVPQPMVSTDTVTSVVIPGGANQAVWLYATLSIPSGVSYIDVSYGYTATTVNYTTVTGAKTTRVDSGGYYCPGSNIPTYAPGGWNASDYSAIINVNHMTGDIYGGAMTAPYWGSSITLTGANKGKVGATDLMQVAFNWNKPVAWTGLINPTDPLHLASITGAKRIGSGDLMAVAFHWGQKWNLASVPADPPITAANLLTSPTITATIFPPNEGTVTYKTIITWHGMEVLGYVTLSSFPATVTFTAAPEPGTPTTEPITYRWINGTATYTGYNPGIIFSMPSSTSTGNPYVQTYHAAPAIGTAYYVAVQIYVSGQWSPFDYFIIV
jgi:hypothetical protein